MKIYSVRINPELDPLIKKVDAIKLAGSQAKLARLLGIDRATVSLWHEEYIPALQAYRLLRIFPDIKRQ
jgi:DNA-binding transcriptional regulator YdaS (Cro superfamily)